MNLKFWEKDDPLQDLSSDFNPPSLDDPSGPSNALGTNQPPPDPLDAPPGTTRPQYGQAQTFPVEAGPMNPGYGNPMPGAVVEQQEEKTSSSSKDNLHYEVIIARLDAIKAQLDGMNQRLLNLEQRPQQRGPWYTNR